MSTAPLTQTLAPLAVLSTPLSSATAADPVDPACLPMLLEQNALFATALAQLPHGLSMFDAEDRLTMSNARYREIWDLPAALVQPGATFKEIMGATRGREVLRHGPDYEPPSCSQAPCRRRREWLMDDGRVIEVTITRLAGGACVALHEDITAKRRDELRIVHMARHDGLTDLPNLAHLREELQRQMNRTTRGEELAVLCLDLDDFKAVNDTLGHGAGDALLMQVADRLRRSVRDGDLVARLGGDEFAIVQVGAPQPTTSAALGRRVIEALTQPFQLGGHQAHIGCSVGIAIAPSDADQYDVLLKNADLALYRAKADGQSQLRFFEPGMDTRMQTRRQLEAELRGAIERHEFELVYQPQVSLERYSVSCIEALLRWNHPTRGRVLPADFIPLAEDTGLIIPIGRWVLNQAAQDAARWPAQVRLAVNVSPVQFRSRSLVDDVFRALASAGLDPQRLELEITEAALFKDPEYSLSVLHEFRERGVRISMDDFGTGYSSLSYLRRFPFDKIKIDRSFVTDVERGGDALAIVQAVNSLAGSLRMATTVEGVETLAQLAAVRQAGCHEVQGFVFSEPQPAAAMDRLIAEGVEPADASSSSSA